MMNTQVTNKTTEKSNPKSSPIKETVDQKKTISQLKQEIRTLNKVVKEMQQKPAIQTVMVPLPQKLLSKANAYLSEIDHSTGVIWSISTLMCEALDLYLWAEEENKRMEEEQ
jgi:hypothetical protein